MDLLAAEGSPWLFAFLTLAGLFSVAGGVFDWERFMANRKARLWVKLFGRGGARGFFVVLGLGIAVLSVLLWTGTIQNAPPG